MLTDLQLRDRTLVVLEEREDPQLNVDGIRHRFMTKLYSKKFAQLRAAFGDWADTLADKVRQDLKKAGAASDHGDSDAD